MVEILLAGNASPLQTTADGVDAYRTAVDAGKSTVAESFSSNFRLNYF